MSLTAAPRSTVRLRSGPLPGPAPAANTTASAPSTNRRRSFSRLQIAHDRLRPHPLQVGGVVRVADQPAGAVAPFGQQPLQVQRDLPVSSCDDEVHRPEPIRPDLGSSEARSALTRRPSDENRAARGSGGRSPRFNTRTPRAASARPRCGWGRRGRRAPAGGRAGPRRRPRRSPRAATPAISGPVNVAPAMTRRAWSITSRVVPGASRPTTLAPASSSLWVGTSTTSLEPGRARGRDRVADGGHLRLGEHDPRRGARRPARSRVAAARIASAAIRAWYFPMCVRSARPLTSPTAYSQSRHAGARSRSSTSIDSPGSSPTESSPRSSVFGLRPTATSSRSARTGPPPSMLQHDLVASAAAAVAAVASRTSTPASRSPRSTSSPANGSSRASSRSAISTSVTSAPSVR